MTSFRRLFLKTFYPKDFDMDEVRSMASSFWSSVPSDDMEKFCDIFKLKAFVFPIEFKILKWIRARIDCRRYNEESKYFER